MRYWVYINEKVDGPYDENSLVTLKGFTPDTLICSEEVASKGGQEWVKASSIFEFDEIPVSEPLPQTMPQQSAAQQPQQDAQTQALLAQLQALTSGMSNLQSKLDSMQHNLDNALEQNKKLSDQVAQLSRPNDAAQDIPLSVPTDDPHSNTITLTRHDMPANELETSQEDTPFPTQSAPEEEEVIIRSALDSMYGGKPVEIEDTFQDLMPEKTAEQEARKKAEEEQAVHSIEPELEFIPVQEEPKTEPAADIPAPQPQIQPVVTEEPMPLPADALDEIEKEMTSLSLGEIKEPASTPDENSAPAPAETEEPADEKPTLELQEAVITTPSLEETQKDALINELTASPKEDILDQIIAEHEQAPASTEEEKSSVGEIALGAAAAGLAAASVVSLVNNEDKPEPAPLSIATDKENPEKLEEVLPAKQMPADNPQPEPAPADLPSVDIAPTATTLFHEDSNSNLDQIPVADTAQELPQAQELQEEVAPQIPVAQMPDVAEQPVVEPQTPAVADLPGLDDRAAFEKEAQEQAAATPAPADLPEEDAIQELVPHTKEEEPEGFYIKEEPEVQEEAPAEEETPVQEETPAQVETPAQEETAKTDPGTITDKDLQDAFGNDDTEQPVVQAATVNLSNEPLPESNPNELTEIELKEGSTYLISDFVPPAQLTDNVAEVMKAQEEEKNKKEKDATFQDMLAVTKSQSTTELGTEGLPDDISATQINLENTIQAKRGAAFDIKTVPMVPEPTETERLNVNELNDVTAQHGLKTFGGLTKSTKAIILTLVCILFLIILYVLLGLLKVLPASVNLFAGKPQAAVQQTTQEILAEPQQLPAVPAPEVPQGPTPAQQAQEKVQQFPLPNGFLLKAFIESKHAGISPELITWETTEAVEADNYSVTVKVPPENPQNFKTVYRFNYNMVSGLLDPTVSDAKNLLDQAYGIKQQAPAAAKPAPAKKATAKTTARKGTSRKRS